MNIKIKGTYIDSRDGCVTVGIKTRLLTEEETAFIQELFPHCNLEVEKMLVKEAVIAAIVTS